MNVVALLGLAALTALLFTPQARSGGRTDKRYQLTERGNMPEGGATQAQRWRGAGWSQVAETPEADTAAGLITGGRKVVGLPRSVSWFREVGASEPPAGGSAPTATPVASLVESVPVAAQGRVSIHKEQT